MSAATSLSFDAAAWAAPPPAMPPATPAGHREPAEPPLAYNPGTVMAVRGGAWAGVTVTEWAVTGERVDVSATPCSHLVLMVRAGRRQDGESRLGGTLRSSLRDMAGAVTVVPAGVGLIEWHRPGAALRMLAVTLDPAAILTADSPAPVPRLLEADGRIGATVLKLRALLDMADTANALHVETLAMLLLLEIGAARPRPGPARGGLTGRQRRIVCDYIEAHLDEQVTLGTLAELAGVSPFHLCRAFKAETGLPPHRWQIRRRVERAREMLADPRWNVTQVGFDLGFGSSSHFAYRFRQETGMTPTEYRRSLRSP